ncbi:Bacterial protein of uncharacterised function (DUF881) [Mycobacteroides abscessus]|nr:Bacterial protein of uncharacterised function (DUF881) [Mycobacteroides abscessus]CPZ84424.1 Bacterial protein of uncharacterised function (DUF881) [Mycobacteroides abscessus]
MLPPCGAGCLGREPVNQSHPGQPDSRLESHPGKHEMPKTRQPPTRSQITFGVLGVALCALLGLAITTQVRQTESGDGLDTARPADLLVLLDSLQQREANLNKEIADLQQSLITMRASGTGNQAVINDAKARLSALSIMVGTVGATGPGVILTINDPGQGLGPEALLDIVNELRAAGAEAIEITAGDKSVRIGVDSWIIGAPGQLVVDGTTLTPPYSVLAIGDPPTLAAAMNIPGGAVDTVSRAAAALRSISRRA